MYYYFNKYNRNLISKMNMFWQQLCYDNTMFEIFQGDNMTVRRVLDTHFEGLEDSVVKTELFQPDQVDDIMPCRMVNSGKSE